MIQAMLAKIEILISTKWKRKDLSLLRLLSVSFLLQASLLSAQSLDGAWRLESYSSLGKEAADPAGIMIFTQGRFGMIYAMGSVERSARAHAGAYSIQGNEVTFDIPWWVEHVEGKARVVGSEVKAGGRYERRGDSLTIHFESGSAQRFKKLPDNPGGRLSGAWILNKYEGGAKTGPSEGTMLFADGHFVLVYTMKSADGWDGRGHGGYYRHNGSTLTLGVDWDLHFVGGETILSEKSYQRETTGEIQDTEFTLTFSPGNLQTFRRP